MGSTQKDEKVLHRQPDSVQPMDKMMLENLDALHPNDFNFTRFGLKNPGEVIKFLKSDSGKQVRNSIMLELEKKKFFQETIAMEKAERKQVFLSMMAAFLYSRAAAAENKQEQQQETAALQRLKLLDQYIEEDQKALKDAQNQYDAYPKIEDRYPLYAEQINLHDLEEELALLNELTNELVKSAGFIYEELEKYIIDKEHQLEDRVNKALENLPDNATEDEKEAERLKEFGKFVTKEFQQELEGLDKQVSQTSEAKSTEPGMGSAPKPMLNPQNEKEKQAFGKLKQAFAQHMLKRVNQVAAVGDLPTAAQAAQANMNINPEQFRSNITAHHTPIREQFDAFRNGFSDKRKALNDQITVAKTNISKYKTQTTAAAMKQELQHKIIQTYNEKTQTQTKTKTPADATKQQHVAPTPFSTKP